MSNVDSVLVTAAYENDFDTVDNHYSNGISLETVEKMFKWARRAVTKAKDDEKNDRTVFVFELAERTIVDRFETGSDQLDAARQCVEEDWKNLLWALLRYGLWTSDDLATLYVSAKTGWLRQLVFDHLEAQDGQALARFKQALSKLQE